ncbi:MAG TPA: transposase [Ktedonobacteraceae bacterium]
MRKETPLFANVEYNGHNYKQPGFYGITLCTYHRRWFFGTISDGQMLLNQVGRIAQEVWARLANRWPCVQLHEYVFMPNHMHSIIELIDTPGQQISVFEVIRAYKAQASYTIRKSVEDRWPGWQEGGWKAVILSETRLANARQYISNNPANWTRDRLMREDFKKHEIRRSRLVKTNKPPIT